MSAPALVAMLNCSIAVCICRNALGCDTGQMHCLNCATCDEQARLSGGVDEIDPGGITSEFHRSVATLVFCARAIGFVQRVA